MTELFLFFTFTKSKSEDTFLLINSNIFIKFQKVWSFIPTILTWMSIRKNHLNIHRYSGLLGIMVQTLTFFTSLTFSTLQEMKL